MKPGCCPTDYAGLFKWQMVQLAAQPTGWTKVLSANPNRIAATFSSPAPGGISCGINPDPNLKVGVIVGSTWGNWECTFDHYGTMPTAEFWARAVGAADTLFITEVVYCGDIAVFGAPPA